MREHLSKRGAISRMSAAAAALTLFATGCGGARDQAALSSSRVTGTSRGVVTLDSAPGYRAPGTVTITVADSDLDLDPAAVDGAHVTIASTTTTKAMNVNLKETGASTGVFTGAVQIVLAAQKGALTVSNGDTLTITYQDDNDGTGGAAVVTATAKVDNTSPDLTVTAASGPAGATAGETIAFTGTVANDSVGGATGAWVGVSYLLRSLADGSETHIVNAFPIFNLAAGQSVAANASGAIPTNLPTGDYAIIAVADYYGYVAESSESNNVFQPAPIIHVTGLPLADLTVTAAGGPSSATAGETVAFTGTVANAPGVQPTYAWVGVSYFLKSLADGSQTHIVNAFPIFNLPSGQSVPADASGAIPTNLPTGDYAIIAVADYYGYVAESDESNNVFEPAPIIHVTGLPLADLTVTAAGGPSSATAGETIAFTGTVANAPGVQPTYAWVGVSYFLRSLADGSETHIVNAFPIFNLPSGQSVPADASGAIPTGLLTGDYAIIAVADYYGYVAESNESNNVFQPAPIIHVTGLPLADLTVMAASGPSYATAGETIAFTGTVANAPGVQPTYAWVGVSYFLRSLADGSQTHIVNAFPIFNLPSGQSVPADASGAIPTSLPTGDYAIIAVADYYGYVAETDETNNVFQPAPVVHVTGLPLADLTVTAAAVQPTATAGETIAFTGTVTNAAGVQPTYAWVGVSYFLKSVADGTQTHIVNAFPIFNLPSGQSVPADASGAIPTSLPEGDYYLVAVADYYGYVAESNESNNVFEPAPIIHVIGLPLADLTVTDVAGPPSARAGATVGFTGTVANAPGVQPTYAWTGVSYFLRSVADGTQTQIANAFPIFNLPSGQSVAAGASGVVPAGLPGGDYYIVAVADYYGYVAESNEENNVFEPAPLIRIDP